MKFGGFRSWILWGTITEFLRKRANCIKSEWIGLDFSFEWVANREARRVSTAGTGIKKSRRCEGFYFIFVKFCCRCSSLGYYRYIWVKTRSNPIIMHSLLVASTSLPNVYVHARAKHRFALASRAWVSDLRYLYGVPVHTPPAATSTYCMYSS